MSYIVETGGQTVIEPDFNRVCRLLLDAYGNKTPCMARTRDGKVVGRAWQDENGTWQWSACRPGFSAATAGATRT